MRRFHIALSATVLLSMIVCAAQYMRAGFFQETETSAFTSESYQQAALQEKIARRAAGYAKPDKPDEFDRFHQEIRSYVNGDGPLYPDNYRLTELKNARQAATLQKANAVTLPWVSRGPGNVGGRTRAVVIDPADASNNTWYTAAVGGGVWKTDDAGESWRALTDDLPNLAATTLAMAASNNDIMYVGTGEGFSNIDAIGGDGIFKSTDRGESWTQLASTAGNRDFRYVNRLVIDPSNADVIVAATNTGIFRSTDGGGTFSEVYDGGQRVQDLRATPGTFNPLFAGVRTLGVARSTDGGATWTELDLGSTLGLRYEVAISPSNPQRVATSVQVSSTTSEMYMSDDAGDTWKRVDDTNTNSPENWLAGQGWYDNVIAFNPFDEDKLIVGGVNLYDVNVLENEKENKGVTGVDEQNTQSFMAFVNFSAPLYGGRLDVGVAGQTPGLVEDDFATIEVRFGPGRKQMAHRFLVPEGRGSGVADDLYSYADYVEVPFEVWDTTNDRQLMVSFRDQGRDGNFNLRTIFTTPGSEINHSREYLYINAVPYDADNANASIATMGGHQYKNLYFMWPILSGGTWNPDNLPESVLRIRYENRIVKQRRMTRTTNWFRGQAKPGGGEFPFVHADHHGLELIPIDASSGRYMIVNTNDGGVELSRNNGTSWSKTLNGYVTTQFYGADKMPGGDRYMGGMQDNGTWSSLNNPDNLSDWRSRLGGDGFECIWHATSASKMMGSIQFNNIRRSLDGGVEWSEVDNYADAGNGPFITSLGRSKQDGDFIFTSGPSGVWRSDNFGDSWTLADMPSTFTDFGGKFSVHISIRNPLIVWAGMVKLSGGSSGLYVSTDGGNTFKATQSVFPGSNVRVTSFATHPVDDSTAYATFAAADHAKVIRTRDLGRTWEDITQFSGGVSGNGFPDVATYGFLVHPHNPTTLWAATEIGIFKSTDDGVSWAFADNGLPAVAIWGLHVVDDQIIAATHGRGVWSVTIDDLNNARPPAIVKTPRIDNAVQSPQGAFTLKAGLRAAYDSTHVLFDDALQTILPANAVGDTTMFFTIEQAGLLKLQLVSFKDGNAYPSGVVRTEVLPLTARKRDYFTSFDASNGELFGDGFSFIQVAGFQNNAAHSQHPYEDSREYILNLSVPIIVATENATVNYEDIAIVEPGEDGIEFGNFGFWDYVVVEGTRDNIEWLPLAPGYDARASARWLSAYNEGTSANSSMFVSQSIDLLDTFDPGDVILIRFRLSTDESTTSYGWVIDNLSIQGGTTGVDDLNGIPDSYSLSQNFPNPFNPTTQIRYALPEASEVKLQIYNMLGQQVRELVNAQQAAGRYEIQWDGRDNFGQRAASGMFIYRIIAGEFVKSHKMILMK